MIGRLIAPLARMRLRHKLAVSLSIAALLPVVVASYVAVSVVLGGLDRGLRAETERQLHVGLNLVLRQVERLGADATRLAGAGDLSRALTGTGDGIAEGVDEFLAREAPHLPSSLIQIADERGEMISERVIGGVDLRFIGLRAKPSSSSVQAGLSYERRVTIVPVGGVLVVRAVAPVVDDSYMLQGVVVVSVPLDGEFTDSVKAALGADVLIFAGAGDTAATANSTFLGPTGARQAGIEAPQPVARAVAEGKSLVEHELIAGRRYAVGYTPLMNLQGQVVGIFAVAVDRAPLLGAKSAATRSLALGAAGAFVFALGLAALLSRRLTRPIARLHSGAIAVARGDLDHRIHVAEGDEIGDLAVAFQHMTKALKENQERLAARMREIVALHDAGRAVSSVIDLDQVLKKIVDSVARVFEVRLCALWLVDDPGDGAAPSVLRLGAARAKHSPRTTIRGEEGAELARPLSVIATEVARGRATVRVDRVAEDVGRRDAAISAGVTGSLLAMPLERKDAVVGVIIVGRTRDARAFSEADANLLATFADQAAAAVENARLYEEVRAFNEELEGKVRLRTAELTHMNTELGKALNELRDTQSQLILSERLAGLGLLVAGVAHEINSPSAAIRGSSDALADNVARLTGMSQRLSELPFDPEERATIRWMVTDAGPALAAKRMPSAAAVRRVARALRARLIDAGIADEGATAAARGLAELDADEALIAAVIAVSVPARRSGEGGSVVADADELRAIDAGERARAVVGYLTEYVFLHRSALTIRNSIKRIQRIVRALKTYSHLDQEAGLVAADIHEGIEDTLVILDYQLRDITVCREYGDLPRVPIFVDELNQVWTNLIHNAIQALEGQGTITIRSEVEGEGVLVRVIDDGPGIPEEVRERIFEPFFTTKAKGEGTGLGLGIVQQIVDKHNGWVRCLSEPGQTSFDVWLPSRQPGHKVAEDGVVPNDEAVTA